MTIKSVLNKNILSSFFGSISQWYEFVVYGFCATFLGPLFFPSNSEFISTLLVFSAFAGGFLVRPLGALLFGYFGDKYSRKKAVGFSIILIGLPTVVMGLIPTYQTIGIIAPITIIVVRLLQGLSVGGQFTGSAVFINEHIGSKYRYLGAGITFSGAFFGMLLASLVGTILTRFLNYEQMLNWGWRLPFLLGILIIFIGYYVKTYTAEPEAFSELKSKSLLTKRPISDTFKFEKINMLLCALVCWLTPVIVYQLFIFMPTYAKNYMGVPLSNTLHINTISMIFLSILVLFFGFLADLIGCKKVVLTANVLFLILGFPFYYFLSIHPEFLMVVQIIFALLGAAFIGPIMGILTHLFAIKTRYTALSFSYNLGFGIFGGTVALIDMLLIELTGISFMPGIYLSFSAAVSLIALIIIFRRTDFFEKEG